MKQSPAFMLIPLVALLAAAAFAPAVSAERSSPVLQASPVLQSIEQRATHVIEWTRRLLDGTIDFAGLEDIFSNPNCEC